ncbi:MAG: hypothetical protein JEZ10_05125 [Verrucomicrobia bacterium]|nr:hypothetical protein [Verrucomicrobiota bacterium]
MIRHILIADANSPIQHLFDEFFKGEGVGAARAADGLEALLQIKEKGLDLLLADIIWTVWTGWL